MWLSNANMNWSLLDKQVLATNEGTQELKASRLFVDFVDLSKHHILKMEQNYLFLKQAERL